MVGGAEGGAEEGGGRVGGGKEGGPPLPAYMHQKKTYKLITSKTKILMTNMLPVVVDW